MQWHNANLLNGSWSIGENSQLVSCKIRSHCAIDSEIANSKSLTASSKKGVIKLFTSDPTWSRMLLMRLLRRINAARKTLLIAFDAMVTEFAVCEALSADVNESDFSWSQSIVRESTKIWGVFNTSRKFVTAVLATRNLLSDTIFKFWEKSVALASLKFLLHRSVGEVSHNKFPVVVLRVYPHRRRRNVRSEQ